MTEQPPSTRTHAWSRRRALYRTVLSVAIAALVAAWLPFSVLYIDALSKHSSVPAVTWKAGRPVLTTKTSGQAVPASAPVTPGTSTPAPAPVTTRAS